MIVAYGDGNIGLIEWFPRIRDEGWGGGYQGWFKDLFGDGGVLCLDSCGGCTDLHM